MTEGGSPGTINGRICGCVKCFFNILRFFLWFFRFGLMLGISGVGKMSSKVSSMVSFWSKIFSGAKELAGCFLEERTHTRSGTISIKSVKVLCGK